MYEKVHTKADLKAKNSAKRWIYSWALSVGARHRTDILAADIPAGGKTSAMADRNPADAASDLVERAEGCLIGGLIGDAMGTPSEGLEPDEIERRFGWIDRFAGDGTDDSMSDPHPLNTFWR